MTNKIFRSIFIVAAAVLMSCLVIIMGVMYDYFTSVQKNQLKAQTELAAKGVENDGLHYFDGIEMNNYRITWVDSDGTVLYDTTADAATMENHGQREEIRRALETGESESERTSATLAEKTLYRAKRLSDGTVLRVSVTQYTVVTLVMGMLQPILIIFAAAIALSAALARRLAKRVVAPLADLDLEQPLDNDVYEELAPLLTRMERQRRQIELQMGELARRQDELTAVTGSMNEGLILLNEESAVLSINRAAARLFGVDENCVGQKMLTVNRSLAVQELVKSALSGKSAETVIDLKDGTYQIDASPIMSDGRLTGVAILTFDITEKAHAERLRREFSANVSHELKTPLQSILGSAELLENGLVKREDMPRFIGHIRTETSRLVTLIDDIIRLSQLDEGGDMPRENVSLRALADEATDALCGQANTRNITVAVHGGDAEVYGVRRLLYEIVYNLCDNAIKYNVENGRVDICVSRSEDGVALTVADTGIGIPPEHQARVFERFYRVDKSHSKQTGGTGLGLSIVKHAAQHHGASIGLKSEPGKGTAVSVMFPCHGSTDQNIG